MTQTKVVWLIPSLGRGSTGYPWHPVLKEFFSKFPKTQIFTTQWPGFAKGYQDSFSVSVLKQPLKTKLFKPKGSREYGPGFMVLPPSIFIELIKISPNVIITKAFSLWTVAAVLHKILFKSRVVIAYEGSSPKVDYQQSKGRTSIRRFLASKADALFTNTEAGKDYLTKVLGASPEQVFVQPYEIASPHLLFESKPQLTLDVTFQNPIFISVGQLIPRKGVNLLLEACVLLKQRQLDRYTLLIAGSGPQQEELESTVKKHDLQHQVKFLGWVDYSSLGYYFERSDVFVFPTLADTWGLVTLEAMAIGKPAICSKYAGTCEMIEEGKSGYVIDPYDPQAIADAMSKFILQAALAKQMGEEAKQHVSQYTPEAVTRSLETIINFAQRR